MRATPASTAASSTRSVPCTLASYIAGCFDFGMPTLYIAPMWKTASAPATPRRIASTSERSPWMISAPSAFRASAFAGVRASATTSSPRSRSRRTTCSPMKPVPPVTKAFTGVTLIDPRRA